MFAVPRLASLGSRSFIRWLAIITAVALAVRLFNIWYLRHVGDFLIGDALVYHGEGLVIADGHGWIDPLFFQSTGFKRQLAMHPPGYPAYLAFWSFLGFRSVLGHQLVSVLIGLATVILVGLAGRRYFSERVGIVAAFLAAIHPSFWSWDGMVLQETLAIFAAVLLLLAYRRLLIAPSRRSAVIAGLASGFAPLVRAELLAGVVLAALLVLWRHGFRRATAPLLTAAAIAVACIAPWAIYNSTRFANFVPLSNGFGVTLSSTHCPELDGDMLGYWSPWCAVAAADQVTEEYAAAHPDAPQYPVAASVEEYQRLRAEGVKILPPDRAALRYIDFDESQRDAALRDKTVAWIKQHPKYEARAILARWGRVIGVYKPIQQMSLDTIPDGRKRPIAVAAWIGYFALLPWFIAGAVHGLRKRRDEALLLLIPLLVVLITVTMTFGNTRYRAIAEPTFVIFGAAAIVRCAQWIRGIWAERYSATS